MVALLTLFAYTAQVAITRAVFLIPASSVMPFNYILVVVSFAIDVLIFHQKFNWLAITGILVVCLSLLYIIRTSTGAHANKREPVLSEHSLNLH